MDKVFVNVDRYGNMSSASIPVALDEAVRAGAHRRGLAGADGGVRRRLHVGRQRGALLMNGERIALLFPGQGSQAVGMGRDLAERFPAARAVFEEADEALGFALSALMWEGPAEELTLTVNAQPALLTHSAAVWAVLKDADLDVVCAGGHSLGEFSAYHAAGSLSFADAVRTVRRRGELMLESGNARPGTMAAVLGLDDDVVEGVCREASAEDCVVVPANFNSPGQVVDLRRRGGGGARGAHAGLRGRQEGAAAHRLRRLPLAADAGGAGRAAGAAGGRRVPRPRRSPW